MQIIKWTFILLFIILVSAICVLTYQFNNHPSLKRYESVFLVPASKEAKGNRLTATFLGVTTILISDGETSIITDGFLLDLVCQIY